MNGECRCRTNFSGAFCQYKSTLYICLTPVLGAVSSKMFYYILILVGLAALIAGIYYITLKLNQKLKEGYSHDDLITGENPQPELPS